MDTDGVDLFDDMPMKSAKEERGDLDNWHQMVVKDELRAPDECDFDMDWGPGGLERDGDGVWVQVSVFVPDSRARRLMLSQRE